MLINTMIETLLCPFTSECTEKLCVTPTINKLIASLAFLVYKMNRFLEKQMTFLLIELISINPGVCYFSQVFN